MNEELKEEIIYEIWSWIKTIFVAVCLALFITNFVIVNARVPTGSMSTTIKPDDRLVANRLAYIFNDPSRGDIIVFPFPDTPVNEDDILYVKRIIGMPGETIEIIEGDVYINSVLLNEPYVSSEALLDSVYNLGPITIPDDHYFMLGDNRGDSLDSRYWVNKFLDEDDIVGKAVFKYYPKPSLLK